MKKTTSSMSQVELDATDVALINLLQEGFPLTRRPFSDVSKTLGLSEETVIARVNKLRTSNIFTRFGPFFDAAAMGGAFCLCAMAVPEDRFDEVAEKVNAHQEVAHNYERSHALNMWFVLATQTPEEIAFVAQKIERETGLKVLCFPKLEEFFIGFKVAA